METHVDGLQNHTVSEIENVGESKVYSKDLKTGEMTLLYQY